ncbi:hypothetical protein Q5752_001612 [Cryptotrichosporon argae]
MAFHPFEVNAPHLVYTLLGGFTVVFGLFSLFVKERLYLGEAPIATLFGIILGPYVSNLFDPYEWGGSSETVTDEITLEVTRVVIAIGVFAVGVELPKAYMKKHWRSLFFLLGPCMVYGWMISALLIWALIPGLNFLSSLVIAAGVTPTDPILAQAVVGGKFADKHVPAHIRHLLSAESGSNDGAAFPFLYIALYLILDASDGHAVGEWFYATWLYEIALGVVLGSLLGFSARKVMKFVERKRLVDRQSFVAQYVSLALLAIGMCTLLGSDDLLAAFACGTAFAWDGFFNRQTEDAVFSNVIDLLFNCAAFIYIGAIIPFHSFADASIHLSVWRLVVLAILILLIRRLPAILVLYKFIPDIKTLREAAFTGWFGPMGVGAIFISTLARTELPVPAEGAELDQVGLLYKTIGPITAFLVLSRSVQVEVIRNYFHDNKPTERSSFSHPHPLKHHEVDKLAENVHRDDEASDDEPVRRSSVESGSREGPTHLDGIHTSIPASRIHGYRSRKPAGWRRFVPGLRSGTPESLPRRAEEGMAQLDSVPPIPIVLTPSNQVQSPGVLSQSEDRSLQLTRTQSARAIRFAPGAAESSETAPGSLTNYGNANPAFRRTPGLSVPRTTSVQSTGSARSGREGGVSFLEPEIRR